MSMHGDIRAVFCENTSCRLNMSGSCQDIGTLLLSSRIGGLPGPLSCSSPVYDGEIGEGFYAPEYLRLRK